ncbi:MAG: DUF1577 domain-containing protein [Spirochaetia bacterium]|nr:DUF1577 domain-containing protein [Spirochaetia bacterium]
MNNTDQPEKPVIEILETLREDTRECSIVNEPAKISYLLKEYILGKPLFIKHTSPPVQANINTTDKENVFTINIQSNYDIQEKINLYLTYKRHMELVCKVIEKKSNTYLVNISEAIISNKPRTSKRLSVEQHEVFGHHFYISKNKIDVNPLSFSVSNKVLFKDAERILSATYPYIKIFDMDPTNQAIETKMIKKHGKGFFMTSLTLDSEVEFPELETLPVKEALGDSFVEFKTDLVNKGIKSWLVRPILYTNVKGDVFPIGYFVLKSSDKNLEAQDYINLQEQETKIVERIKDANTIIINQKHQILNLSTNGALIEVADNEFQEYLLQRTDMTFDLLFKYMAGLRFYSRIHHIHKKSDGKFLIGLGFHGVVHTGVGSTAKSRKFLEDSLGYLIKQGAKFI